MTKVDGAWKRNVRKNNPSAGIGWIGVLEMVKNSKKMI